MTIEKIPITAKKDISLDVEISGYKLIKLIIYTLHMNAYPELEFIKNDTYYT